jgi:curli biogenesis system outer membrane secretion channel CsgG
VVERSRLDAVRRELNLQYSGEVDDASAASLGKFLGAQAVITGSLTPLGGGKHRVRFTAIDVETAMRKASRAATVRLDPMWNPEQ